MSQQKNLFSFFTKKPTEALNGRPPISSTPKSFKSSNLQSTPVELIKPSLNGRPSISSTPKSSKSFDFQSPDVDTPQPQPKPDSPAVVTIIDQQGNSFRSPADSEDEISSHSRESEEDWLEDSGSESDNSKHVLRKRVRKASNVLHRLKKQHKCDRDPGLDLRRITPTSIPVAHDNISLTMTPNSNKSFSSPPTPHLLNLGVRDDVPVSASHSKKSSDSTFNGEQVASADGVLSFGAHEHHRWTFLTKNRLDKSGHPPHHPDFNPRTLSVPQSFLKDQTPAMKQWIEFKCENMDTILFFKVGKFYELYHMDADVGVKELDLVYMRGTKAHSGFPEISYAKYSNILITRGYRVARVEQTETPDMMKERNKSAGRGQSSKVVTREMCCVVSKGTRTFGTLDDQAALEDCDSAASVLLCLTERLLTDESTDDDDHGAERQSQPVVQYGVCMVDTLLGTVTVGQFEDDENRVRLRTMVSRHSPSEIVLRSSGYGAETSGLLRNMAPNAVREVLRGEELLSAEHTVRLLVEGRYYESDPSLPSNGGTWPPVLKMVVDELNEDGTSAPMVEALGSALWILQRSKIDYEILSLGRVYAYVPPDDFRGGRANEEAPPIFTNSGGVAAKKNDAEISSYHSFWNDPESLISLPTDDSCDGHVDDAGAEREVPAHMVLDAVALSNLEILATSFDHQEKGSLWHFVNRCRTPFGRRLLRSWLINPLFRVKDIKSRSDAIEELLIDLTSEAEASRNILRNVPDLERLLSRVHSNGIRRSAINHPDSRAVMFEEAIYNGRKIREFAEVLSGFEDILKIARVFENSSISSPLLRRLVKSCKEGGKFPVEEMSKLLGYFRSIFDENQARRDGAIRPHPGVNSDYDSSKKDVSELETGLENYLIDMKKLTGIQDLKYFGTNKDRFQLEVPMSQCHKVPKDWSSKSQKKTHRRYWTGFIEFQLSKLVDAETRVVAAQNDTLRSIFQRFDDSRAVWSTAVSCVATVDAILSLAAVSSSPRYCRPEVVARCQDELPVLRIVKGRHPMLEHALSLRGDGSEYIPNDLTLGGASPSSDEKSEYAPRLLLLSGPNMGGKSTLLRQSCLIVLLAQIGCRVPADQCCFSPVDRIFTRVGASDRILAGQSTFYVELAETSNILRSATKDSLCILDELGRGTATFDGTAIAHAVVEYLVSHTGCRGLFATHYHSLVDDWSIDPRVCLGHMDCLVQGRACDAVGVNLDDMLSDDALVQETDGQEVTFLYRLCNGSCPKSYGINVAKLARLPLEVLRNAATRSHELEKRITKKAFLIDDSQSTKLSQTKDAVLRFFEKLVSLQGSEISSEEYYYVVQELWDRYNHLSS